MTQKIKSGSIVVNPTDLQQGSVQDLLEDRSAYIRSADEVTWSGTALSFTTDIVLDIINTSTGTITQHTVLVANSPITLANGESAWVSIDRTLASENLTVNLSGTTPIPAHSNANRNVFVLFRRVDALGSGRLHIPLHKQLIEPGQTIRIGSSSAGAGAISDIQDVLQKDFKIYVEAVDNAGFTDNANTNPRGILLGDLKYVEGAEVIEIHDIRLTGKSDSNGLPEWEVVSPRRDLRVRLYGMWRITADQVGTTAYANNSMNTGQNYCLVTGMFDSIGIETLPYSDRVNNVDVRVDNADTGVNLDFRAPRAALGGGGAWYKQNSVIISDASLTGLGFDLHTVKFTFAATDAATGISVVAIHLVGTGRQQIGGNAILTDKLLTYASTSPAAPSVGNKGATVTRMIDASDYTVKDAIQNCTVLEQSVASISSGASSVVLPSATGFAAGNIVSITDGASNSELLLVTSVVVNTLNFATNTQNSYTSATVALYGRSGASTDHSNEEESRSMWVGAWGTQSVISTLQDMATLDRRQVDRGLAMEDMCHELASSNSILEGASQIDGIYIVGTSRAGRFTFHGTGLDVFMGFSSAWTSTPLKFLVDGVEIAIATPTAGDEKWIKIISDLPEGSHTFQWENGTSGTATMYMNYLKTYRTKKAATAVDPNGLLANYRSPASYLFLDAGVGASKNYLSISKGVTRQSLFRFCSFATGTGGTTDWTVYTPSLPTLATSTTTDLARMETDRTNAKIERWFYGNGVDVSGMSYSNAGISEIYIDDVLATTANFPGATFHGASYTAATGLWDLYTATNDKFLKVGIEGLTQGWHKVTVKNTGTKNVSSGGYWLYMFFFDLHGNSFEYDICYGINPKPIYWVGAVRDLRNLNPEASFEYRLAPIFGKQALIDNIYTDVGVPHICDAGDCVLEVKEGECIEFTWMGQRSTVNVAAVISKLVVDGVGTTGPYMVKEITHVAGNYHEHSYQCMISVPPGFIHLGLHKICGSGSLREFSGRWIAKAVPAIRGRK
jgi:hypothetical protein